MLVDVIMRPPFRCLWFESVFGSYTFIRKRTSSLQAYASGMFKTGANLLYLRGPFIPWRARFPCGYSGQSYSHPRRNKRNIQARSGSEEVSPYSGALQSKPMRSLHWATVPVEWKVSCTEAEASECNLQKSMGLKGSYDRRTLPLGNEHAWTVRIRKHVKCGQAREALSLYEEMLNLGVKLSSYTCVAALKACSSLHDLKQAQRIHAGAIHHGFDSVVYVANMLVYVYAKCGSMVDARNVFDKMPFRTVASWNVMILGYAQMGDSDEALKLFAQMQLEGLAPNERTFVGALKAYSSLLELEEGGLPRREVKRRCLEQVKSIHACVLNSGVELPVFVGSLLVNVYAKCGSLDHARRVFESLRFRDVVSWTAMILGYAHMGEGDMAFQLYKQMQQEGVVPNHRTYVGALKACSCLSESEEETVVQGKSLKKRSLEEVKSIHKEILKCGFQMGSYLATVLADAYAKSGSLMDAVRVFDKMPHRDVVSWSAMILRCAQLDKGGLALQLYSQMQQEAVVPNNQTFVGALKACGSLAVLEEGSGGVKAWSLKQARAIHSDIVKSQRVIGVYVGTMLVDVYAKCGSLDDARRVFEMMPNRNVISWNALILGYAQMKQGEGALRLFAQMQQAGVEPDERTFVGVLNACTTEACLELGRAIHAQISNTTLEADSFVATSLIDMYGKCGSMLDAQRVFDRLLKKDVVTCSALISGYAQQGASEIVFEIFGNMRREGIRPDGITFLSLLTVCTHVGLVDKGQTYFEAMTTEYGIAPTVDHCNCVVDLLGRAGRLHQALLMARTSKSSSVVWTTLLGACQKWKHVEIGRTAFEIATELDKNNPAAYVLMFNIYAAANMWEDAETINKMRLNRRAWKQPGQCAWTDSAGASHVFSVDDRKHAESQHIYSMLCSLSIANRDRRKDCLEVAWILRKTGVAHIASR